jgi:large subunit ribosomal protein L13
MVNSQVLNKGFQEKNWYILDASGSTLGRLATEISKILIGKHKPSYAPYLDNGDCVIVINATHIKVTGKKETQKLYYNHSGYPGGMRVEQLASLQERFPEKILERAIRGMLPKNALGRKIFKNVKIYKDTEHPHDSQNPKLIELIN